MDVYSYAAIRNLDELSILIDIASKDDMPIKVLQLDAVDDNWVKNTVNQIKEEKRRIDVLVKNLESIYLIFGRVIYL
jgi:NADP-dependent 3-hydroxy acid dehydrogenase YdfG